LTQKKTLARKIEEILIVWLIENNNIMTKNRILEVYFNIVEWGPNIYGIREAASYYFGKGPSELTLGESIYLASIVPKPRTGLYAFLPDGSLRPGLINYFNSLGRLMAGQYLTQRDTTGYGFYDVRLREGLRREIEPVDSATAVEMLQAVDADDEIVLPIIAEPEPIKRPNFIQRLFGKKDTITQKLEQRLKDEENRRLQAVDSSSKSNKEKRQEKRAIRKEEKARRQELKDKGLI
jgi:hypothetical protein